MSSSQPPSAESLDEGWGLFSDVPLPDDEDDTRTVQMSSPLFKGPPTFEEGTSDERDTMPPPVPVSEYVQTMMQQAAEDPEPSARPLGATFSWQGAMPPSSRRGEGPRAAVSVPARRRTAWSVPPTPRADAVDDDDDDDNNAGFTLIAFEPERLGGAVGDVEDPRFRDASSPAPGFDDLPFDDVIAASQRASAGLGFPTPPPVRPSNPPSSRREPSLPPLFGNLWESEPPPAAACSTSRTSPPTKRGIAVSSNPPRPQGGTQRYGSIGDASVQPRPTSATRAPIVASLPTPPPAPADPFDDVRELYDAGDFRSALVMAEALLETEPEHVEARECAAICRETLATKYLSRLGGRAKILRVAMPPDEIRWLSLDHKAGFLLSCIDGTSSIEEVLDVACMHEFEAIRILHDFRELGVIEILPDPRASRR